jgi:hypothetical protein
MDCPQSGSDYTSYRCIGGLDTNIEKLKDEGFKGIPF